MEHVRQSGNEKNSYRCLCEYEKHSLETQPSPHFPTSTVRRVSLQLAYSTERESENLSLHIELLFYRQLCAPRHCSDNGFTMALHSQTHAVTHAAKSYIVQRKTGLAGASACQAARMSLPVFRAVEYGNIVTNNKAVNSLDLLLHLGAGRFTNKHNCIPSSQAEPPQMSSSLGILIVPARHSPFLKLRAPKLQVQRLSLVRG